MATRKSPRSQDGAAPTSTRPPARKTALPEDRPARTTPTARSKKATTAMPEASAADSKAMVPTAETAELVATASRNTLAINPLIGLNQRDIATSASALLKAVVESPHKATTHYASFLKELSQRMKISGEAQAGREKAFVFFSFTFSIKLLKPLIKKHHLWFIIYKNFYIFSFSI